MDEDTADSLSVVALTLAMELSGGDTVAAQEASGGEADGWRAGSRGDSHLEALGVVDPRFRWVCASSELLLLSSTPTRQERALEQLIAILDHSRVAVRQPHTVESGLEGERRHVDEPVGVSGTRVSRRVDGSVDVHHARGLSHREVSGGGCVRRRGHRGCTS